MLIQGLENVLWSFATLNHKPSHKLLLKTSDFMTRNLSRYNQQNLALTLWAYAKLGFEVSCFAAEIPLSAKLGLLVAATESRYRVSKIGWRLGI
jgi:hypothetical protein